MAKRGRNTKNIKTPKADDPKGYLDSNKEQFTDYKVIKGNKITMKGVSGKIYAIPVDAKGNAGQGKLLKPGEEHMFEGAAHVIEVPDVAMAQLGINGSNNQKMEQLGILPMISNESSYGGGSANDQFDINDPLFFNKSNGVDSSSPLYNEFLNGNKPVAQPTGQLKSTIDSSALLSSYEQDANMVDFNDDLADAQSDSTFLTNELKSAQKENTDFANRKDWVEDPDQVNTLEDSIGNGLEATQKIQFDNPYGGVDIPTAAQTLGASLSYDGDQKGMNTARGVASGLKLLTGLGRNVMSGYAQNKRNQWVIDEENRKQQNQLKGQVQYRQTGGKVSAADLLTGSMTMGDPSQPHNVEVEDGEHIKDNRTGQVQEVVGKKHSQGGERMNLEDHKVLSDYTKIGGAKAKKYRDEFDINVKAKDTYATVMDKVLKKTGYKDITEELTSVIEKTEKEQEAAKDRDSKATTGINMQYLSGKIHDLNKDLQPLEEMKSNVFETLFNDQESEKPKAQLEEEMMEMQEGGNTEEQNRKISRKRFEQFANTARRLGYEGKININAENLDAEAAKLQEFMVNEHPEVVIDYAKRNRITAKGLNQLKANSPELFEQVGLDINKEPAQYTDEELAQLSSIAQETGAVDDEFWKSEFNDGLWRYRAPQVGAMTNTTPQQLNMPRGTGITADLIEIPSYLGNNDNTGTVPVEEVDEVTGERKRNTGNGRRTALLPDQHILPPSTMQPHRLGEITPRESEAKLISPEAQIEELNRQAMSQREAINSLPDTQRRAALAQLNAQTQQSINQVMSQTNRANAQIEGQNEQANIARGTQADMFNEQAANLHERNMLLAKDNTERDIRNYFNALNKKQVANYNTINNMNLTNAMYDNFQYDGNGNIIQTGKGLSSEEATNRLLSSMGLTEQDLEEAKKKKKTAKRGRRIK